MKGSNKTVFMGTGRVFWCFLLVAMISLIVAGNAFADTVQLPKTGQTTCYRILSLDGSVYITGRGRCTNTGQDGDKQAGVAWPSPRFTDNNNGTVTDNLTGLVWLKNANCFGRRIWKDALGDVNTLASGKCGLSDGSKAGDWRLPNIKELRSLIDYSKNGPALPQGHPFSNVQSDWYWSSTTCAANTGHACLVNMSNGSRYHDTKDFGHYHYVWPVRSGQ